MNAVLKAVGAVVEAGFRPPAIWLGLAGLVVVSAVLAWGPLAAFASAWYVPALISLAGWLAMAATQVDPAVFRRLSYELAGHDPYLVAALERRDALAAQIDHLTIGSVRADAAAMLRRIDRDLLPELATRLQRHRFLLRALAELERGQGPLVGASRENMASLRRLAEEQREALDGLLSRLSDVNAALIGLTQEADQRELVEQARQWAEDLGVYWQATAEVFRPADLASAGTAPRTPRLSPGKKDQ
ncbi:MAG: hypothetical protein HY331_13455 [Chloroflexi bacterium]|nr:hypothetical protein [Chloroflexota bacterium]